MVSRRVRGCRAANRLIYTGYLSFYCCSSFIHLVLSPVLADFAGLSDEEILAKDMEKLWNDYGDYYSMMLLNESFTMTRYMPLDPDTEYIAFAYGLSDTEFKATTKLCKVVLRTPAAEGSSVGARTLGLLRR